MTSCRPLSCGGKTCATWFRTEPGAGPLTCHQAGSSPRAQLGRREPSERSLCTTRRLRREVWPFGGAVPARVPLVSCDREVPKARSGESSDYLRRPGPGWTAGEMEATLEQHLEDT